MRVSRKDRRRNMRIKLFGLTVNPSALEALPGLDASRWRGKVAIVVPGRGRRSCSVVMANWAGAEGAADGMLRDVEGEDEAACERIDRTVEKLSERIAEILGDPCSPGERSRLARRAEWYDEGAGSVGRRAA
jgi:hypothetical protein